MIFAACFPPATGTNATWRWLWPPSMGMSRHVRMLLDAGEDPNRYHPVGGHSHTTPLHQAAGAGNFEMVRLLVECGARLELKDVLWNGTPADWARHGGKTEIEKYLRGKTESEKPE